MAGIEDKDPREALGLMPRVTGGKWEHIPKSNLDLLLDERGMSYADLADLLWSNRDRSDTVGQWVSGKRWMSDRDLVKVAATLDVSPLYLLDLSLYEWPRHDQMLWSKSFPDETLDDVRQLLDIDVRMVKYGTDEYLISHICEDVHFDGFEPVAHNVFRGLSFEFEITDDIASHDTSALRRRAARELCGIVGDYRDPSKLAKAAFNLYLDTFEKEANTEWLLAAISKAFHGYMSDHMDM